MNKIEFWEGKNTEENVRVKRALAELKDVEIIVLPPGQIVGCDYPVIKDNEGYRHYGLEAVLRFIRIKKQCDDTDVTELLKNVKKFLIVEKESGV